MKNALQTATTQAQSHTDRDDDNGYHNSDYSDNSSDDDSDVSDNGGTSDSSSNDDDHEVLGALQPEPEPDS